MTIKDASVLVGTTLSGTGGTATGFLDGGDSVGIHNVALDDSSEFINQTGLQFTTKAPKVLASAPNGYTQRRCTVVIQRPLALDNDGRTVNTLRMELAVDIETTAAEVSSLLELGAQVLFDSDYSDFWQNSGTA